MGDESAALRAFGEVDFAELGSLERWKVVVFGEAVVREDEVALNEVRGGKIFAEQGENERASFFFEAFDEVFVEAVLGEEADIGIISFDVAEV